MWDKFVFATKQWHQLIFVLAVSQKMGSGPACQRENGVAKTKFPTEKKNRCCVMYYYVMTSMRKTLYSKKSVTNNKNTDVCMIIPVWRRENNTTDVSMMISVLRREKQQYIRSSRDAKCNLFMVLSSTVDTRWQSNCMWYLNSPSQLDLLQIVHFHLRGH